ncbi:MAG: UbiA family prenyltransferase [Candidatus Omnitrophica bacterium]|nr:UbiA family prenyltransferase [Candidatus Omnitrophota bacterium]
MTIALALDRLKTYAGFVKLEHTIFSLPLIYAGALVGAQGWPSARLAMLILLAAVGGRVTAMGLNRLIDAELDRRNPRTQMRELPRGAMARWEAWLVIILANTIYFAAAGAIAPVCLQWAWLPLGLFVGYPYLKRFTSFCHAGLGLAWSMAPLGGWLATAQSFGRFNEIVWLWLFAFFWVTGFDVIYATLDEQFDREAGIHSLPAQVGKRRALRTAALLHAAAFLALWLFWRDQPHSPAAFIWLLAVGALFIWQHAVAERKPEFAFFQLNAALGFLVFGFVLSSL